MKKPMHTNASAETHQRSDQHSDLKVERFQRMLRDELRFVFVDQPNHERAEKRDAQKRRQMRCQRPVFSSAGAITPGEVPIGGAL
jgi:hypothetical protein